MKGRKTNEKLVHALSEMKDIEYGVDSEIDNIHQRLKKGRDTFAKIYDLDVNVVAEISALDLEIKFYIKQLMEIAGSVAEATKSIHSASADSTEVAAVVAERHEDLTNTIINVSEQSNSVYEKIDSSQQSLTEIRKLSENTIEVSEKMQSDMNQLSEIINHMNEVIVAINAISSQTNLLSLNASIEAARAGEAGRGFAVVADEIRSLADETKKLTDDMGSFVASVQSAAEESVNSVAGAIVSLEEVNTRIKEVWSLNEENQSHLAGITESISNLAAVSEEISSSMNEIEARSSEIEESCQILQEDTGKLKDVGDNCSVSIKPIEAVEKKMDDVLVQMGAMSSDVFYAFSQKELTEQIDTAIQAHKNWVQKLETIIESQSIIPFQVDGNKCKFGHFFNSINPDNSAMKKVWNEIGEKHKNLHKMGAQVISAMFDEDYGKAKSIYKDVVSLSQDLMNQLEHIGSQIPQSSAK